MPQIARRRAGFNHNGLGSRVLRFTFEGLGLKFGIY